MATVECLREPDVLDAVTSGRWPDRCEAELSEHVASCSICADLLTIVLPLQEEQARAWQQASVPPSRVVWWRAHMRARVEAAETIAEPMTFLHAVTAVSIIAVAAALVSLAAQWLGSGWFERAVGRLVGLLEPIRAAGADLLSVSTLIGQPNVFVVLGFAAWLVLAPIALYLVLADE